MPAWNFTNFADQTYFLRSLEDPEVCKVSSRHILLHPQTTFDVRPYLFVTGASRPERSPVGNLPRKKLVL